MKNKNIIIVRNLIRCLDLDSLRNPEVVANLVRCFGIVNWGPLTTGPEIQFIVPMGIAQTPDQIAKALVYLSRFKIDSFCEVGVYHGGNFLFTSEYLSRFNPEIQCLGVDPTNYLDSDIRSMIDTELFMSLKSITSEEIKGREFDFVFIDGEHRAPWPAKDYENVGQYAKICGFHDLQDPGWPDVAKFWETLKGNRKKVMVEFLDDPSGCSTHGIGIIHDKEGKAAE
jgi:hypothetical protein